MLRREQGKYASGQEENNKAARKPDQIDRMVADQVRAFREAKGLTLEALGSRVGVTPQQIQKYETCQNRIAAGTLFKVAQVLGVAVERFFERVQIELLPEEISIDLLKIVQDRSVRRLLASWQHVDAETKELFLKLIDRFRSGT